MMVSCIHRLANLVDPGARARRCLIVNDANGLDRFFPVLLEMRLDRIGVGPDAPIGRDDLGLEPEILNHVSPEKSELPRLDNKHAITR